MEEVETADTKPPQVRLAFRVAYLGTGFSGSQQQPGIRTVEGVLIDACIRLGLIDDFRSAGFVAAGRTDANVSALGQVVAFSTPYPERAVSNLNRMLPFDCWCTGWAQVPQDFHPRYHARSRTYRYIFPSSGLDRIAMEEASSHFVGIRDFTRLSRLEEGRDPIRCIYSSRVFAEDDVIVFEVMGKSFLWNMVRGMATLLLAAGSGLISPDRIEEIFSEKGDRIPAAPPDRLILWDVDCGIEYHPLAPSDSSACRFAEEERRLLTRRKMIMWLGGDRPDVPWKKEVHDKLGHLL